MDGRAFVFRRQSGAPLGNILHFGHVAWGFQLDAHTYFFGSTENFQGAAQIDAPGDNGQWTGKGDLETMLRAMQDNTGHMPYDDYKVFRVITCNPQKALQEAKAQKRAGYTVLGNNCADHVYRVIAAYGGVLPLLQYTPAPNDWFMNINAKMYSFAGPHKTVEGVETDLTTMSFDVQSFEATSLPPAGELPSLDVVVAQAAKAYKATHSPVGSTTGTMSASSTSGDGATRDTAIPAQRPQTLEGSLTPEQSRYYRMNLAANDEIAFTLYTRSLGDSSFANASFAVQDLEGGILAKCGIPINAAGEDFSRILFDYTAEEEGEHLFRISNDESKSDGVPIGYKIKLK